MDSLWAFAFLLKVLVLAYVCFNRYKAMQFVCKISFYYFSMLFVGLVMIPYMALSPNRVENMIPAAKIMQRVSAFIGLHWRIHGQERLRQDKAFVVVVNHQHSIDILGLFHCWPLLGKCSALAKKSLLYAFPFGPAAWLAGTTFIDRNRGPESRRVLEEKAVEARESRTKVLVFPEGTRHHVPGEKELLPFKKGAFSAALVGKIPILPIVIQHYFFLDTAKWVFDPATVDIHVLEPIQVNGDEDIAQLAENTRNVMLTKLKST